MPAINKFTFEEVDFKFPLGTKNAVKSTGVLALPSLDQ